MTKSKDGKFERKWQELQQRLIGLEVVVRQFLAVLRLIVISLMNRIFK